MRLFALLAVLGLGLTLLSLNPPAAAQIIKDKKDDSKPTDKDKKNKAEEDKFDQTKEDLKTLQAAGIKDEVEAMLAFIKNLSASETDRIKIIGLIKKLGDDDFKTR